jgi:DNA-binding CsgD family transcriptional regulator
VSPQQMTTTEQGAGGHLATGGDALEAAEELLTGLLDRATAWRSPPPNHVPSTSGEVILDMVVDGIRYQLLRTPQHEAPVSLSSRELEIARMIANGHTNRTIAAVLDISPWTVSTHLRRVFAKLNVGSRAAMVALLVADGMFAPAEEDSPRGALRSG